jgi:hypothetical protein
MSWQLNFLIPVTMTKLPRCVGCAGGVLCWARCGAGGGGVGLVSVCGCVSHFSWRRCFGWRAWVPARSCGWLTQTAAHHRPSGVLLLLLLLVWGQQVDPQVLLVGTALQTRYVRRGCKLLEHRQAHIATHTVTATLCE